ncbi:hypothetical protein Patl1_02218 [Pistacia atlantica]|uniref:Uncharacterized protein n=1 Tax=Pistacia atlantica TaxID=434234 RepID=A0ACC1CAG8_9ROSI|nr:hypothetical protein Patl1_02218 [Pistacia atlantica]
MAADKNSGKSKKGVDETTERMATSQDWDIGKGKDVDFNTSFERRQQWRPVLEEASISQRPLKKIRSPERFQSSSSVTHQSQSPSFYVSPSSASSPSSLSLPSSRFFPFAFDSSQQEAMQFSQQLRTSPAPLPLFRPPIQPTQTQQQMISFSSHQPQHGFNYPQFFTGESALAYQQQQQQLLQYCEALNLSPRGRMMMMNSSSSSSMPSRFLSQSQQAQEGLNLQVMSREPMPPPPPPQPQGDNPDSNSGIGSSEVTASDEMQAVAEGSGSGEGVSGSEDLVWGEMAEAWLNAIPAGWGPGSPVWDDLDATNNLLMPSNLPFVNQNQHEFNEPDRHKQQDNLGSASSSSSSCPMKPFFWKDQDG